MLRLPHIRTERLQLRPLKESDWETVSYLRSDQSINQFVRRPSAETKEKALAFIEKINTGITKGEWYYWAISEKASSNMMGSICLWKLLDDGKKAEVGYDLSPSFQGKGFMGEALKAVMDFGFKQLQLEKLEAYTHHSNTASIKLLEKYGFTLVSGKKDPDNADNVVFELNK